MGRSEDIPLWPARIYEMHTITIVKSFIGSTQTRHAPSERAASSRRTALLR